MLVLSRQRDETIIIGDAVELTIVDIRGDKVRLGIKAPSAVSVHRKEVFDAIRSENQGASTLHGQALEGVAASPRPASETASAQTVRGSSPSRDSTRSRHDS
jgi:carbon storage regulator